MKAIRSNHIKAWLVFGATSFAVGCAMPVEGVEPELEEESDVAESAVALERRLVDRAYPYSINDDAIVCGDWEFVAPSGEVVDVYREWYPMETMNRHLDNVGTAAAVGHVDDAFRAALLERGTSRIETCDQARQYVRLAEERLKLMPVAELDLPDPQAFAAEVDDELPPEDGDELRDKILNGASFDHPSTVAIDVAGGASTDCTANLIGPTSMLTAAHCVPSTGFIALRAWIQPQGQAQQCISHPGGGACPALGTAATVYAQRHPNYDGTQAFDQAVVIHNPGWYAPANNSARWTRFAANWGLPLVAGLNLDPIRIAGYGKVALTNGTFGEGLRGNSTHTIENVNPEGTIFQIKRVATSSSAICRGDSGSGPYNTTLLNANLLMGITSTTQVVVGTDCTAVGFVSKHSIPDSVWIDNLVTFFNGVCTVHTHTASGTPFMKCW